MNRSYPAGARAAAFVLALGVAVAPVTTSADTPKPGKKPDRRRVLRDLSKGNTMYVVPYAHLDTQWRWAYPQVVREYIANTLHRNFDLIDKYPNYVFNFSGSRRYEMMKEYYPADYERLKSYIKAGRWFPCGSSVDENDANVPSGESLIRHVLYGNHYFRREFGVASDEYMLPDCFGFPYALPSILAHCGIKGFSTQKLTWGSANGIPFKVGTWEGPDGKSVVAALDPGGYGAQVDEDLSQNTSWLARIQNTGKQSGAYVDYKYYGTGDIGGAPGESSVQWVEKSIAGSGPISVVSSEADEMVNSLTKAQIAKLPRYKGELLLTQHSAGSISSQAYMKRWNRKNEQLADAAERASVAAMWLGGAAYPSQRLYTAWDLVLGSQMHDMLPGTSIPKAYEFCWNDELLAQNQFAAVTTDAVAAVASAMDTRSHGVPLVVYNPLSIAREDVVEATLPGFGARGNRAIVYGPDGKAVPTQLLSSDGGDLKILFLAKVPSAGFAVFDARPDRANLNPTTVLDSTKSIENDRFKVTVNAAGDIGSIYDKANKREVLKAPARLDFQYENPAQYPAWNMDWADAQKPPYAYVDGPAKIRLVEDGPVRWTLRVERENNGSKFVQDIRLTKGGGRVEVANKIDWQTKETALKASFPLNSANREATYDLQLGAVKRGNNDEKKYEVPQHQWFDLTKPDGSYGVGILNDSKFASDKPSDDTVRLTLIYTPGVRGGYADQSTQDFGRHDILFAIAPHSGDWRKGEMPWQAKRLNQPLEVFAVSAHSGKLGKSFSMISTDTHQVEIQALKKAEDGDEIIVRLRELTGSTAEEVKLRTAGGIRAAREVDGQERPLRAAKVKNGSLVTDVPAFSLRSFALRLGGSPVEPSVHASQSVILPYDVDAVSSDKNPGDGSFDARGRTYAAERLPNQILVDGIAFKLGLTKDRAKNALSARGQTIQLPAGYSRVYVLAASSTGDVRGTFRIGKSSSPVLVQGWGGYIGQWDNRLWSGDPGPNFSNYGDMVGLEPGYVKPAEVAWYASHRHTKAGNTFYDYSYLFKYGFGIPAGARTLTLPNDPAIKVFAVTVTKGMYDPAVAAQPLYDHLTDHKAGDGPTITQAVATVNGAFDTTTVSLRTPLYWRAGMFRYTLDGSDPTASSAVYRGPFVVNDPVTVKIAEMGHDGKAKLVAFGPAGVRDVTAPRILAATSPKVLGLVRVRFSERVTRDTAENTASYRLSSPVTVQSAKLSPDQQSVELTLDKALPAGQTETIAVSGIKDLAKAPNTLDAQTVEIAEKGAVFISPQLAAKETRTFRVENLPVKAKDAWTINLFCKVDARPEDRTIIAGFGRARDGRTGTGRYFTQFPGGINFWSANRDVRTNVQLDLGKFQMLTATYDGATLRVYKNGDLIGEREVELANDQGQVQVMPLDAWDRKRKLDGEVQELTIWDQDLSPTAIKRLWSEARR